MPRFRLLLLAFLCFALAGGTAEDAQAQKDQRNLAISATVDNIVSDKKVALVIGNSAYAQGPLKNPVNDAADMANKLRSLGFEVVERNNLKTAQIGRTLREFRAKLTNGAVALFFYAGHGLQIRGDNYLPAVDADIEGEEDVPNQSIAVRQVLELMEDAKTRLNLAFLDACRNNPYARSFRSAGEGLAKVSAPSGTLVSFATRPGSVAADGSGRNGLYTSHLLSAMDAPNQPVELMLKRVTTAVKSSSQGRQEPWMEGSIEGDFYFKTVAYTATPEAQAAQQERQQAIDRAVQEAVNAANEKAAKERAELQATMQRMIEQAMAKQTAMLEAERKLREETLRKSEASPSPAPQTPAPPAVALASSVAAPPPTPSPSSSTQPPASPVKQQSAPPLSTASTSLPSKPIDAAITVAALSPNKAPEALQATSNFQGRPPQPGDEWEYAVKEEIFGAKAKLIWRVKAATSAGTLEELVVNDQSVIEWVFGKEADAIGAPISTGLVFGHSWRGNLPSELNVHGLSGCVKRFCALREMQIRGNESVAVPAGKFETTRVDAYVIAQAAVGVQMVRIGRISFWYDESSRRLIKQEAQLNARFGGIGSKETVELLAVRQR